MSNGTLQTKLVMSLELKRNIASVTRCEVIRFQRLRLLFSNIDLQWFIDRDSNKLWQKWRTRTIHILWVSDCSIIFSPLLSETYLQWNSQFDLHCKRGAMRLWSIGVEMKIAREWWIGCFIFFSFRYVDAILRSPLILSPGTNTNVTQPLRLHNYYQYLPYFVIS